MSDRAPLAPGDTVIDLGGLCQGAAALAGAISGGVCWWPIASRWFLVIAAIVAGGIGGATVGGILAGIIFRNLKTGHVAVVKKDRSAIGVAIFASFLGAVPTVAIMTIVPLVQGFPAGGWHLMVIGVAAALLTPLCMALASTRL